MKIPDRFQVVITPDTARGFGYVVRFRGGESGRPGQFISKGYAASRKAARESAWLDLEASGLVIDGVDE